MPEDSVKDSIMLAIWSELNLISNYPVTERSKGNSWDRVIPYDIEQKYTAWDDKPVIAIRVEINPHTTCPIIRYLNFMLSFVFIKPNTNRKIVLSNQKSVAKMVAFYLSATYDNTAYDGAHPPIVASKPTSRNSARLVISSSFFELK